MTGTLLGAGLCGLQPSCAHPLGLVVTGFYARLSPYSRLCFTSSSVCKRRSPGQNWFPGEEGKAWALASSSPRFNGPPSFWIGPHLQHVVPPDHLEGEMFCMR